MFRFEKIKRELGAGAGSQRQAHSPPAEQVPNDGIFPATCGQVLSGSPAAREPAPKLLQREPAQSRKPGILGCLRYLLFDAHSHSGLWLTLGSSPGCHSLLTGALAVSNFSDLAQKRWYFEYSPEARDRAHLLLPFPSPQGFPTAIAISCSRNPAKLPARCPLYNQSRTCCAAPYSITDRTPRRWPWTKHCHRWVAFPPTRWQGHLAGTVSPRDSRGVFPRCCPSGHVSYCAQSSHQCEPTLSLFSQVEDLGGAP